VDRLFIPQRAHIQIACLEIEKTRRAAERRTASQRVAELDARLRVIEAEEAALMQGLAEHKRVGLPGARIRPTPQGSARAFRIRY
jgi:hypothetical protein